MIVEQSEYIVREVGKAITGKDEVIRKVLMTIYAGGHILLEDCPGVGKTTLAIAFSKAMGLDYKRVQFTIDTVPSDITGFTMYNHQTGQFDYHAGAADCNLLLGDEINRTSPKTQAALLEAMEEKRVTVDGVTHTLPTPFICIATQNPLGTVGTQPLPDSQMDRFMVRLSIGYPTTEQQIEILRRRRTHNPLDEIQAVTTKQNILDVQRYLGSVRVGEEVLRYAIRLCEETRSHAMVEQGISPRGIFALASMARAHAVLEERDYVVPDDVRAVYFDVCAHRLTLKPQTRVEGIAELDVLQDILKRTAPPTPAKRWKDA